MDDYEIFQSYAVLLFLVDKFLSVLWQNGLTQTQIFQIFKFQK